MIQRSPIVLPLVVFTVALLLAGGAYFVLVHREASPVNSTSSSPTAIVPSSSTGPSAAAPVSNPVLSPPLAYANFPTQTIDYPTNWPNQLRYPAEFHLVEAIPGTFSGGGQGWGAAMRYQGAIAGAADTLTAFFSSNGWSVTRQIHDSGAIMLQVECNNGNQLGGVVINLDASNPGDIKVLAIVTL